MKISKKFAVLCMALIMAICTTMTSTVSWYSHDNVNKASGISYSNSTIYSSDGEYSGTTSEITMKTYVKGTSKDVDKQYTEEMTSSDMENIGKGTTSYFKTVITNGGSGDVDLNMYLDGLTTGNDTLYGKSITAGCTHPTWNYINIDKSGITSTAKPDIFTGDTNDDGTVTVYFQPKNLTDSSHWKSSKVYVLALNTDPSRNKCYEMTDIGEQGFSGGEKYVTYKCRISSDIEKIAFTSQENPQVASRSLRTATVNVRNAFQSAYNDDKYAVLYYPTSSYSTGTHDYYDLETKAVDNVAHVTGYVGSISMNINDKKTIAPTYSGTSITYTSSSTSVASVDSNGQVTGKGNGVATITAKVTGELSSSYEVSTKVVVVDLSTPIVTNLNVPHLSSGGAEGVDNQVEVYWYIKNDSEFDSVTAKFSGIILSL